MLHALVAQPRVARQAEAGQLGSQGAAQRLEARVSHRGRALAKAVAAVQRQARQARQPARCQLSAGRVAGALGAAQLQAGEAGEVGQALQARALRRLGPRPCREAGVVQVLQAAQRRQQGRQRPVPALEGVARDGQALQLGQLLQGRRVPQLEAAEFQAAQGGRGRARIQRKQAAAVEHAARQRKPALQLERAQAAQARQAAERRQLALAARRAAAGAAAAAAGLQLQARQVWERSRHGGWRRASCRLQALQQQADVAAPAPRHQAARLHRAGKARRCVGDASRLCAAPPLPLKAPAAAARPAKCAVRRPGGPGSPPHPRGPGSAAQAQSCRRSPPGRPRARAPPRRGPRAHAPSWPCGAVGRLWNRRAAAARQGARQGSKRWVQVHRARGGMLQVRA